MNYHDALRYLYSLVDYEKRRIERYSPREFKIERVEELLEKLGAPHRAYPTLHVAGTKGKGSVSAMLATIAQTGGLRTGLYTSPHLHTYRERIQINGEPISRGRLAELLTEIQPVVESIEGLTTFEVTTALAFLHFAREKIDLGVMEVGLGGRLDATNVITPEISVIASLSLDHTSILGNTLAEIAGEKGGIIKPGVPVISAPQQPEALAVLESIAAERNAPLTCVGRDWTWTAQSRSMTGQTLTVQAASPSEFDGDYELNLLGDFQQENATVAVAAAANLYARGHAWASPATVRAALSGVVWPGRMEILNHAPLIVVDSAHNPYSAEVLARSLQAWFPETRWLLIFGASGDKAIDEMLRALLPLSAHVIVTRSYHPRAAAPDALADKCAEIGHGAEIAVDPRRALEQAFARWQPGWGILATGSVFIAADVREAWAHHAQLRLPEGDWVDEPW
ncbi:MAG TPA: folylpolyglutamate synthase/dihydrofolate synthase family protein [Anaerolineae bacterium]|nr:folylpolyglutamate synthase/dihydrofolate synthase family protein [Anaerolineae bacterium]